VLAKGTVLNERYVIEERIGSGGYGTVFRARDRRENLVVAIKVLRSDLADDPDYRRRFRREADIARMLKSDHVVKVLEGGHAHVGDEEIDFQVMEFVEGETLQEKLREGPVPVRKALYIAAQIAEALEEAELRGIVHRDVKPKNIFIGKREFARLGDFGIARATDFPSLQPDDPILGTPRYMSPEQALGNVDETDARTDIYSLGVVLYEMIAGKPPFEGDSPSVIAYKHANEQAKPLRHFSKRVPDEVEQLVRRCLAKRPEERFRTASQLREAIWSAIENATVAGDTPITPIGAAPGRLPLALRIRRMLRLPMIRRALRSARQPKLAAMAAAPLAAVIAIGAVIAVGSNGGGSNPSGTPTPTAGATVTTSAGSSLLQPPVQKSCTGNPPAPPNDGSFVPLGPKDGEVAPSSPTFCWAIANTNQSSCLYTIELSAVPLKDGEFPWWYQVLIDSSSGTGRWTGSAWRVVWSGAEGVKGTEPPPFDVAPGVLAPGRYYWRGRGCADDAQYSDVQTFQVQDPWQELLRGELDERKTENRYLSEIWPIEAGDTEYAAVIYKKYFPRDEFFSLYPGSFPLVTASLISGRNGEGPGPSQDILAIYRRAVTGPVIALERGDLGVANLRQPSDLNGDGDPNLVVDVYKYFFDFPGYSPSMLIYELTSKGVTAVVFRPPEQGILFSDDGYATEQLSQDVASSLVLRGFQIDEIRDLDGDGTQEITLLDNSWQQYRPLTGSTWPQGHVVLSWDDDARAFVDQSPKFGVYFDNLIRVLEQRWNSAPPGPCGDVMRIDDAISLVLEYGRSGRGSRGWNLFDAPVPITTDYWKSLLPTIAESLELTVPRDGSRPTETKVVPPLTTETCYEGAGALTPIECPPPEQAPFSLDIRFSYTIGDPRRLNFFTNLNTNVSDVCILAWDWLWDFGDGQTLSSKTAGGARTEHTYSASGVYGVVLTISNELGKCYASTLVILADGSSPTPTPRPVRPYYCETPTSTPQVPRS